MTPPYIRIATRIIRSLLFGILAYALCFADESQKHAFSIPSGHAEQTLKTLSEQSGRQVLYPTDVVAGIRTRAIKGEMTSFQALVAMLSGTPLVAVEDIRTGSLTVRKETPAEKNGRGPALKDSGRPESHSRVEDKDASGETVVLNPFVVSDDTKGYLATNSISATAMNTPLVDLPMSIGVLTSELIADIGANDITDILKMNSSVTQQGRPHFSNRGSNWTIRGFGTRNVLVDGVPAGNNILPQLIDRVEIVKGPNTLYGQSDPGGLINVITKRPRGAAHQLFRVYGGSQNQVGADVDVNVPAANGRAGLRVLSGYSQTDGYRQVDGEEAHYAALVSEGQVGEKTTLLFSATGREAEGVAAQRSTYSFEIIPTDLNGDGVINNTVVNGVNESTARYNASFLPEDFTCSTAKDRVKWSNWALNAGFRHAFTSQTMLQYYFVNTQQSLAFNSREFNTFNAAGVSDGVHFAGTEKSLTDAHTLQLAWNFETGPASHRVLVGGRMTEDRNSSDVYRLRTLGPAVERDALNRLIASGRKIRLYLTKADVLGGVRYWEDEVPTREETISVGSRTSSVAYTSTDVRSIYVTDSMGLLDEKLKVLAGLRYVDITTGATQLGGGPSGPGADGSDLSYQLGANYRFTPNFVVFANTATSFNPNSPDATTGETRKPESSEAYEVGVKFEGLMNGRVSGSIAAFRITKENVVRSDYSPTLFRNVSEISNDRSEGVDLEAFYNVTDAWQFMLGYTFMDAKVVKSQTSALGMRLEGAPPSRATFWTSYEFTSGPLKGWRIGGGGVSIDGPIQQFGTSNNRLVKQSGYTELGAFARYSTEIGNRKLDLGINVNNLTDKFYLEARAGSSTPREIVLSASLQL
ncbi:MAG: TonB-dependent receptor [Opitutaceae bacterium]|nr:TonB-dependent receptor [Opitutaceae bacterium]